MYIKKKIQGFHENNEVSRVVGSRRPYFGILYVVERLKPPTCISRGKLGGVFVMLDVIFRNLPVTPNVWIRNITDAKKYILSWPGTLRGCRHDGGSSTTSGEEPRAVVRLPHHHLNFGKCFKMPEKKYSVICK